MYHADARAISRPSTLSGTIISVLFDAVIMADRSAAYPDMSGKFKSAVNDSDMVFATLHGAEHICPMKDAALSARGSSEKES